MLGWSFSPSPLREKNFMLIGEATQQNLLNAIEGAERRELPNHR